jgi:pSer/pThr/pTyr-binding forkhead associated (FHA) protein
MVQLSILSGTMAGETIFVRHFPFRIGRAAHNELCLEDDGIWDDHLAIGFDPAEGFLLETAPNALAAVNDQGQSGVRLRNGDVISFGSAKVQFWLAPAQVRGLKLREACAWLLLGGIALLQLFLMIKLAK